MPTYRYRAHDRHGRPQRGTQQADSARHARQLLRERGLAPSECHELPAHARRAGPKRLGQGELAQLARQLATLVQAALPLEQALTAVAEQSPRAPVRSLLLGVRARVLEGQPLAAAMGGCGAAFPELFQATVAAGERSGHLGRVLEQLADYTEARQEATRRIQMALVYPCILLCASLAIVGFLLGYVIPDVVAMFVDSGRPLPTLTLLLIGISHAVRDYGAVAILLLGLVGGGARPLSAPTQLARALACRLAAFARLGADVARR